MRPTRSRSRRVPSTGPEPSSAAQYDRVSEEQGSPRAPSTNKDAIARMAEFVAENPNILEEENAESSKRRSAMSPEMTFGEDSDDGHPTRSTQKCASSKATSRIASISKAFSRGLLGKRAEEKPRHSGRPKVDYMRAPPFTYDINEEKPPSNFKLSAIPSYDGRGDSKDHIHAFISVF